MTVWMIPPVREFHALLAAALARRGWEVSSSERLFDPRERWRRRGRARVLHLNWCPPLYFVPTASGTACGLPGFVLALLDLAYRGRK